MEYALEIIALVVSVSALIITYLNRIENNKQTKKSNEKADRAINYPREMWKWGYGTRLVTPELM